MKNLSRQMLTRFDSKSDPILSNYILSVLAKANLIWEREFENLKNRNRQRNLKTGITFNTGGKITLKGYNFYFPKKSTGVHSTLAFQIRHTKLYFFIESAKM